MLSTPACKARVPGAEAGRAYVQERDLLQNRVHSWAELLACFILIMSLATVHYGWCCKLDFIKINPFTWRIRSEENSIQFNPSRGELVSSH